jgi:CheY-like chemotaxis protein
MRRQQPARRLLVGALHDGQRDVVRLSVADTGPGIPPDTLARIFEPFFTTKPPGEGTGLGLSLCRGIIEDHGGTLSVASEVGRGTRFTIDLPIATQAEVPAATTNMETRSVSPKTILVVDDEEDVAAMIAEALAREGHKTETATNGAMALAILSQRSFDLVISDTKMPVMDGEAFFAEAVRRHPQLERRFIFLTGDVLSRDKRESLERMGAPFLTKPCDLSHVRRVVVQHFLEIGGG